MENADPRRLTFSHAFYHKPGFSGLHSAVESTSFLFGVMILGNVLSSVSVLHYLSLCICVYLIFSNSFRNLLFSYR